MAHIVTDSCIACKYTDCITVCPVDCFHEGPNFLVINPDDCIDCALCVSECPLGAIKTINELKPEEFIFVKLNSQLSKEWPVIYFEKEPLPFAEKMGKITDKLKNGYLKKE